MIAENFIPFVDDSIPKGSALSRCAMFTMRQWQGEDADIIHKSISLFAAWENEHPVPYWKGRSFNLYVLYGADVAFSMPPSALGTTGTMIFVRMDRVLPLYPRPICYAIFLEELCHSYYMITDEWEVKEYLLPILRQMYPQISLHHLYPKMFDMQDRRINHP